MTVPDPPAAAPDEWLRFGPFAMSRAQRLLTRDGEPVRLGSRAFDLLAVLLLRAGEIVGNDELLASAWPGTVVDEGNLRVHVAALRKVLGDAPGGGRWIENVPLRGYSFVGSVERGEAAPAAAPSAAGPSPPATMPVAHAAEDAAAAVGPGQFPASLPRLFGREEVVEQLAQRLPTQRLVTLVGPGGAGKTTVAVAVARRLAAGHRDGAWFVDLAALEDPALVPSTLATVLSVPVAAADPTPALGRFLAGKQILLLLDNCERVIDAAATLAEALLRSGPGVCVLATSREPLRAQGEWVHRLGPLALPPAHAAQEAAQCLSYPSVQLFVERASAAFDGFRAGDAELPVIAAICRRLDGIPLAIELAAARIEGFGLAGLASGLGRHLAMLTGGRRTAAPRHRTLRATLDWSYHTLAPDEQQALRALSAFQASFTLDAAAALLAAPAAPALQRVSALALKSLLSADIGGEAVRYRMLDTTRAYAAEQLRASGERPAVLARHAAHCLAMMAAARHEWQAASPPAADWLARHARALDDLRAALDGCFSEEGDAAAGCALLAESALLWYQLSLAAEYRRRAETALAFVEAGAVDRRCEIRIRAALAQALVHVEGPGSPALVRACEQALALARPAGDLATERQMLYRLWNADVVNGEYGRSLEHAERFAAVSDASSDPNDAVLLDRMRQLSLHTLGEHVGALAHGDRVLDHPSVRDGTLRRGGFETDHRVLALTFRARILWVLGRPDEAWRTAREAVAQGLASGHTLSLMYALGAGACLVGMWRGDFAAVEADVALMTARAAEQSLAIWTVWGRCFDTALAHHGHAVTTPRPHVAASLAMPYTVMQQEVLATVAEGLGSEAVAERLRGTGERHWCAPEILRCRAVARAAEGGGAARDEAERLLAHSLVLAGQQRAMSWQLRAATSLAKLQTERGAPQRGRATLQPVLEAFGEGAGTRDLAIAEALLRTLRSSS